MTASVLFHVQHLLGIGHLQRALAITEGLAQSGASVTLVSGGEPIAALAAAPARVVQLPPVRARDARFELVDSRGQPIDEALREARRTALLAAFAAARPEVVVIEGFPFARRAFRFELDPLIAAVGAQRPRPLLLCSIRDILVRRDDPRRNMEIIARVRADFDAVLVHGDPSFIALDASFPPAAEIADRVVYTGYVSSGRRLFAATDAEAGGRGRRKNDNPLDSRPRANEDAVGAGALDGRRGEVVVSAGSGAVGYRLLAAALAARRAGCLADHFWRLLAGVNLPGPEFAALSHDLPPNVAVERHRADFPDLLRRAQVSVSQAGYNTVLEVLAAEVGAVLVPFDEGQETEQGMRAERLAAHQVVEVVATAELTPARLAPAIERAAARGPHRLALDTGGAARSAELILGMVRNRGRGPEEIGGAAQRG